MPEISRFFGIIIRMYWNDHEPPHFHAIYGDFEALIEIETLAVFRGELPRRALVLVRIPPDRATRELDQSSST